MSNQRYFTPKEVTEGIQDRLEETLIKRAKETAELLSYEGMSCDTPIESLMAACFVYRNGIHPKLRVENGLYREDLLGFMCWVEQCWERPQIRSIFVGKQIQLETRCVDFLAWFRLPDIGEWFLAIECDGHEFHVANKAQASRDRRTDRAILIDGIPTMRFTGSEIWADAMACVDEVIEYFYRRAFAAVTDKAKNQEATND